MAIRDSSQHLVVVMVVVMVILNHGQDESRERQINPVVFGQEVEN